MKVSIILPTYNEAKNIPIILKKIHSTLSDHDISHEIIIADDNSPDGTWKVAEDLQSKYPMLRVLRRMENKGLSPAIIDGFRASIGRYLIVMDANMQHDEKVLPQFIKKFEKGASIVIGTRKAHGGRIHGWSKRRKFISWGATIVAKLFMFHSTSDPMSGFFGISRKSFHEITEKINPRSFKILLEILVKCEKKNIEEVGYTFKPKTHSKNKLSGSVIVQYLLGLYDIRLGRFIPIRFLKYGIVGASGVLVNQAGLFSGIHFFHFTKENALILGIELSIISNFLFNNYFTFRDRRKTGILEILNGLILFHLIAILAAVINFSVAFYLSKYHSVNIYLANMIGIIIATIWNFMLNLHWTWKEKK